MGSIDGEGACFITLSTTKLPTANPQIAYADAAVCADCHADKAAGYQKTGMGRSFARALPEKAPKFELPTGEVLWRSLSASHIANSGRA